MKKIFYMAVLPLLLLAGACAKEDILDGADTTVTLTDPALEWSASSAEATIGSSSYSFPTLSNDYSVSVSYSSSDTNVATIDSDGNITLVAAGTTAITASSAATAKYSASSASFALTVYKSEDGISWSASTCTVNIDDDNPVYPTLNNPGSQTITYSSSNSLVASINASTGAITLVEEGDVTITATAAANDAYEASSASYTLTIEGDLVKAGLSWSAETYSATLGSADNTYPTLTNPNSLTVSYSSSDTSVATIDSDGNITLVAAGSTTIIAQTEADDTFAAGSAAYTLKVVKQTVTLSWSESTFKAILEEENTFPTLTTDPEGLSVSYTSSNESVATISSDGNITLVAVGSTTISAIFDGTDIYKAASAAYSLTVASGTDTGAGTYTYDSTGDTSSDDDISNTTFTRMITVTYSGTTATVEGDYYGYASVSGADVTVNNTGNNENIVYKLTGATTSGSFKLYSSKKQAILLSGVSITNPYGAAINNQSGKRTFVMVEGSNYLYDSSSAAYSASNEDMKAVFFSEGQLIFSGSGILTVEAKNKQEKSCIASDDYVRIMDCPTLKLTSSSTTAGHGIRGKEYVQLSSGTTNISSAASKKKGITSEDYVLVEGGTHNITITGSAAYDSEDAEYKGTAGIKADNYFGMTGGTVTITNSGTGGKGIRAGSYSYVEDNSTAISDSYMTGGTLKVTTTGSEHTTGDVSTKAIKIGYKEKSGNSYVYGGNLKISGGTIIASCSKSETIEAKGTLTISGGEIYSTSSADDAINSYGNLTISGGYVYTYTTKGDSIDANGNLTLSGGYVFAVTTAGSPEVALDANTESGYKLYINSGATVVAYGGLESGYSASQTVYTMSGTAGSWNALYNGSSFIAAFKAPSGISSFSVSAPSLSSGYKGVSVGSTTYCNGIWATSGISGGTAVSLSNYSGGGNQGGGPGGNQGGGPGGGGRSR